VTELTLAQRREILASIPWVAVSPGPDLFQKRCEGIRADIPLSARYAGATAPYQCKNRARWVFLGLDGTISTYCWWHLFINGFEGSPEEYDRFDAWRKRYNETHPDPPEWVDQEDDEPLGRS
jgi:hypothetical protein